MTDHIPDAYARTIFRGRLLDQATAAALREVEADLGYELTIVQGIGGAVASAGTHTEGRAVDLADWDHERKVRVLRNHGFAAWFRPALPGVWGPHVHAVLILGTRGNPKGVASAALRQIGSFDRGRNGLANDAVDPNPYRPDPPALFSWADYRQSFAEPKPRPVRTDVTRARNQLVETIHALGNTIARIDRISDDREVVKRIGGNLEEVRRDLRAQLERMPKR